MKICAHCKTLKPLDGFYIQPKSSAGRKDYESGLQILGT
jgi:hypothetical protein